MKPLSVFIALIFATSSSAQDNLFEKATQAFAKGLELRQDALKAKPLLQNASADMEFLAQRGDANFKVFRLWAATEILQENFPEARMACLLGLRKYPADPVLKKFSSFADGNLSTPGWRPPMALFASRLAIYFAGITQLAAIGFLLVKNKRLAIGLLIIAWTTAMVHLLSTRNGSPTPFAIVRQESQPRVGNGHAFPPVGRPVLPGAILSLKGVQPGWGQITLSDGKTAWLPLDQLLLSAISTSNSKAR